MATKIEIANMAIANLGNGIPISDFNERTESARAIKQFWDIALESVCRECKFPATSKIAALALVEEEPNSEWAFSYRYPNNCLVIKRILSGIRNDTHETRVPFKESNDASGRLIFTDKEEAEIEFIERPTNITFFPADVALALSFKLSYLIAPRITGGNAFTGITDKMLQYYGMHISKANETAANEVQPEAQPDSEFITVRE